VSTADVDTNGEIEVSLVGHEAQYLSTCRHPSILHLVGTVTLRQGPALITERSACSLSFLLDEGSLTFSPAVRIMYQISSALAYMHELDICHSAIEAESVLLMQRVLRDPIAKLSNFSRCNVKSPLFSKDVVDFVALLRLVTGSEDESSEARALLSQRSPILPESSRSIAILIELARGGQVTASRIAISLSDIDAEIYAGGVSRSASSPMDQAGNQEELGIVQGCGGCFRTR
jgi:serine/threonine protein kinase